QFAGPGVICAVDGRASVQLRRGPAELDCVIERHALPCANEATLPVFIAEVSYYAAHNPVELAIGRVPRAFIDVVAGHGGRAPEGQCQGYASLHVSPALSFRHVCKVRADGTTRSERTYDKMRLPFTMWERSCPMRRLLT